MPLADQHLGEAEGHVHDGGFGGGVGAYCGMGLLAASEEVLMITLPGSITKPCGAVLSHPIRSPKLRNG